MIESTSDRIAALEAFGHDLEFDSATIKGITEIELSILTGESTVYTVERQSFLFQCSLTDILENDITDHNIFVVTDGLYNYTFKLNRPPVSDLLGWCTLYADYLSKEVV